MRWFYRLWPGRRETGKRALVLAGGGVIGGMYEVGVLAALDEEFQGFRVNDFDIFVGSSAGSVVASLMANGVRPVDLYRILDGGLPDPMNFNRGSVYDRHAFYGAAGKLGKLVWALGRNIFTALRGSFPDLLAKAQGMLPAGFFTLQQLEAYMRRVFEEKGLSNDFRSLSRTLLIPAVDLDRAERVVFGVGETAEVPISQAIAASSAIPGFFEPYGIGERDYVDGGVGYTGHADLAVERGADAIVVVNPLVPLMEQDGERGRGLKSRGLYSILEQAGRINSKHLLELGLRELQQKYPKVEFFLCQPEPKESPLFGPSMGFEASRAALRFGYASTKEWLETKGAVFIRRFSVPAAAQRAGA
ncbi:MAG: patatin-like phospholipase family protein [Candidatus Rokubacteria bacterium]|nr:patatin-like phospholipase family protein [Candidatus Rokubacteria bacterium]